MKNSQLIEKNLNLVISIYTEAAFQYLNELQFMTNKELLAETKILNQAKKDVLNGEKEIFV
jgi:hypothetical protein